MYSSFRTWVGGIALICSSFSGTLDVVADTTGSYRGIQPHGMNSELGMYNEMYRETTKETPGIQAGLVSRKGEKGERQINVQDKDQSFAQGEDTNVRSVKRVKQHTPIQGDDMKKENRLTESPTNCTAFSYYDALFVRTEDNGTIVDTFEDFMNDLKTQLNDGRGGGLDIRRALWVAENGSSEPRQSPVFSHDLYMFTKLGM